MHVCEFICSRLICALRLLLAGLCLVLSFGAAPALAQSLPNGGHVSGVISVAGERDTYTLTASVGETILLRLADTSNSSFVPRMDLYRPDGSNAASAQGVTGLVGAIAFTANATGLYTVVVLKAANSSVATGSYDLYYARAPGANEHGALPNGGHVSGIIDLGDMDTYTLTANAGETIRLRVADTSNSFSPRITLYRPDGSAAAVGDGANVGAIGFTADVSGTYSVVVWDVSSGGDATGTYNLYYARAPGANEHGELSNGGATAGNIDLGDLDSYTLTANVGEIINLRVAPTGSGGLAPSVALYRPDGSFAVQGKGITGIVGAIAFTANASGIYTVVVGDASTGYDGTGPYDLYYTRAPGAFEHGEIPNGGHALESIDLGDMDSFTLTAHAGETIHLRVADNSNSFYPRITLYRPNGSAAATGDGANVGAIDFTANVSGTYSVVVWDVSSGGDAIGTYNLYYARAPGANEHGRLFNGIPRSEQIDLGDLDSFTFTANNGDPIQLRVTQTGGEGFVPRIKLYRPDGSYVTAANAPATLSHTATISGIYTVIADNASRANDATGTYELMLSGSGGNPGPNEGGDGDVPLPLWSLVLLAGLMGRSAFLRLRGR